MSGARNAAHSAACCSCISFVFLLIACTTPWMLWGYQMGVGIGTGPFYAGYSATGFYTGYGYTYVASSVWWSEINSANACQPGTDIYKQWSQPNKLCDTNGNFVMPSAVIAIQATTCLATIFSFFACALGYSVTASHEGGSYGAAVASLLAMVFSICAFALWCTWDMSMALRTSPGGVVPLFTTTAGQIQPSSNVLMWYGSSYVLVILAFVNMTFATSTFFSVANQLKQSEGGEFGAGV